MQNFGDKVDPQFSNVRTAFRKVGKEPGVIVPLMAACFHYCTGSVLECCGVTAEILRWMAVVDWVLTQPRHVSCGWPLQDATMH